MKKSTLHEKHSSATTESYSASQRSTSSSLISPRAEAVRVILSELSRIMDHIICIGANVVDLGAITPVFVMFRAREDVYDVLEACCGARLTVSYVRIGGLAQDVPENF